MMIRSTKNAAKRNSGEASSYLTATFCVVETSIVFIPKYDYCLTLLVTMKESRFIEQNNQKWDELEMGFFSEDQDPKKKSRLFIQVLDDLSYARTFYRNRSVREYLNGIAQLLFNDLNLNERFSWKAFFGFFTETFPKAMFATRRSMLVSAVIFTLAFIVGALTAAQDPEFAKEILSAEYVNKTEDNIAKGDPMAIYKDSGELEMFLSIAFNNIKVVVITFLLGVLSSIGTLLIMISNGVMVGVFQYFFIERDLFWTSFLTIWTHGTIEIACIIVAGGAGMQLGKGLLFPGTYSRVEAFKMSAKTALIVIAGTFPLVVIAAFIESFQTRHTEIDDTIKFGFILFCLAFVIFYFIWYPRYKSKNQGDEVGFKSFETTPTPSSRAVFDTHQILSVSQLFSFSIGHILRFSGRSISFLLALCIVNVVFFLFIPQGTFFDPLTISYAHFDMAIMFEYEEFWPMALLVIPSISIVLVFNSLFMVKLHAPGRVQTRSQVYKTVLISVLASILFCGLVGTENSLLVMLGLFILPLLIQISAISNLEQGSLLDGPRMALSYMRSNWGKFLGLNGLFFVLAYCFLLIVDGLFVPFVPETITMLVTDTLETEQRITFAMVSSLNMLAVFGLIHMISIGAHLFYFTLKETNTAGSLFSKIKTQFVQ